MRSVYSSSPPLPPWFLKYWILPFGSGMMVSLPGVQSAGQTSPCLSVYWKAWTSRRVSSTDLQIGSQSMFSSRLLRAVFQRSLYVRAYAAPRRQLSCAPQLRRHKNLGRRQLSFKKLIQETFIQLRRSIENQS
jgi:hypothetical protein